jgi:predicted nucleic acid-binding protein
VVVVDTSIWVDRPTDVTWDTMEQWAFHAAEKGYRFGVGDLLVAAIAAERHAAVWSLDADSAPMQRLGFIDVR